MSSQHQYDWSGEQPPLIHPHSQAKHTILRAYLIRYLEVLTARPGMEEFHLTLIDGFAGGGEYRRDTGELHPGSPLILLQAVCEAEARINLSRTKKIKLNTHYFFIERNPINLQYLENVLRKEGYAGRFGQDIFLLRDDFSNRIGEITTHILNRRGGPRAIFLLDQYGYSDVPLHLIRHVFNTLPKAEIILTFAVDSLIDYLSDLDVFKHRLTTIGLADYLDWGAINHLKKSCANWRYIIQSQLYKGIVIESGAHYFNPFFIHSEESHRDYWLLHLCTQPRARDEMNRIHWEYHTYFRHFGGAGFNMLGYDPGQDEQRVGLTFDFGDDAHHRSLEALTVDIPRRLHHHLNGVTFGQLFAATCNGTPASTTIYREIFDRLLACHEIDVIGPHGERRRKGGRVTFKDLIIPSRQTYFYF